MLGPSEFRDLVSGRRGGLGAAAMRGLLRAAEAPYTLAVNFRNRRYDRGHAEIHPVNVPVISVGNLTLGGTGKTPMVKWLARWLLNHGLRVAIVSRGYRAAHGEQNDEALELALALPDVPHVQNRDRVAAAKRAINEHEAQVVVLDDGFQHRRLVRNLDIVLLDALEPFGFDHVFPRGTLREPLAGLARANVVCLSRADAVSAQDREEIRRRVAHISPHAVWCELAHSASALTNAHGEQQALKFLDGRRVVAFCGIGNPAGFRHTLDGTGCEVVARREFPDHHAYTTDEMAELQKLARECKADALLCTQKDLVKLRRDVAGDVPLWAVAIEMTFLSGQVEIERLIERVHDSRESRAKSREREESSGS